MDIPTIPHDYQLYYTKMSATQKENRQRLKNRNTRRKKCKPEGLINMKINLKLTDNNQTAHKTCTYLNESGCF